MAQQQDGPSKPHGDPLEDIVANNPEENRAQRDSDAPPDATDPASGDRLNNSCANCHRKYQVTVE